MSQLHCTLLFAILLTAQSITANANPAVVWQVPAPMQSEVLKEPRGYRVLLPKGYANKPERQYPLLLLLDGQRYGDLVAGNALFLARVGEVPEHIIVAVDSGDRLRDFTPTDSPHWEGDGGANNFLAFLQKELLPKIEKEYRVSKPRIIWGHSLGGLFSLYALHAAPELFDAFLVNDGTLDWDNKASERLLQQFLETSAPPSQFLYFNSSYLRPVDDPNLRWFDSLARLLRNKAPTSLRWIYEPMPGETHGSIPLLGSIHGIRSLYKGYLVPEAEMFDGLDAVLKHYQTIRGRVGAPDRVPESVLNSFGYLMLGQAPPEAIRAFELATQLYPGSANAWDSLSDGYLGIGKTKDALAATEKSIELARAQGSSNIEFFQDKRASILKKE